MKTDRAMLFVIDGSKALAQAIRAKFGTRALISDAKCTSDATSRITCAMR